MSATWPKPGTKAHDVLRVLAKNGEPMSEHGIWFALRERGACTFHSELRKLNDHLYVTVTRPDGLNRYAITDAGREALEDAA